MSMSLCVIKDKSITFPLRRGAVQGGSIQHMSLEAMYTPHGFIVHYWRASQLIEDYISGRPIAKDEPSTGHLGFVVTHEGFVYSVLRLDQSDDVLKTGSPYILMAAPVGKGYQFVDTFPYQFADSVAVAIRLNDGDVNAAIKDLSPIWGIHGKDYITLTVDEIVAGLKERGFTKPMCIANPYVTVAP